MKKGIIAAVAALSVSLTACSTATVQKADSNTASAEGAKASSKPNAPQIFNVGEAVTFDKLKITVNGVRDSKGDDMMKPKEGSVYKIVDVTIENNAAQEANISSLLQTKMVDGDGYKYDITIGPDTKGQLDGAVGAGRKMRGEAAFEVPADANSLEFIFNDPVKNGEAIWKIK